MDDPLQAQVIDVNAHRFNQKRMHNLEDVNYIFEPGKATPVPMAVAVKYLVGNPGFQVHDADGNIIREVRSEEATLPGSAPVALKADECIARYEELTANALRDRAEKIAGFDESGADKKEDIIAFLVAKAAGAEAPLPEGESDGTDVDEDPAD